MRMIKRILAIFCPVAIALGISVNVYAQEEVFPSGIRYQELGNEIEELFKANEVTNAGMSVGVFDRNSIIYENSFGYADKEKQYAVDENTVFEWGSASKLLVWVSVMQLWEQGKIELEKDITAYLPEEFLSNLTYEEPVTMINLMNHSAGFQEVMADLFLKNREDVKELSDALASHKPEQIYPPGEVTAYSNWGVALAGYIVERISGLPFDAYVKEHIFNPLSMEATSISVDLADNDFVSEQRSRLQCYTYDGELIPDCFYYISLYPAGMCTGTLKDFLTFAQALLPAEGKQTPLFQKADTLDKLLSPSDFYDGTQIALNCHGLWTQEYGVSIVGHEGNTAGCSAGLYLEPVSGIGIVVMTNQQYETIYNKKMPELVYGSFENSPLAAYNTKIPEGFYRSARTVAKGPLSMYGVSLYIMDESDLDSFFVYYENGGAVRIVSPYSDMLKLKPAEYILMLGLALLLFTGTLYAIVTITAGGMIISPIIRYKAKKKDIPIPAYPFRKWNYMGCTLILMLSVNTFTALLQNGNYVPSHSYIWQFMLCAVLALALAVTAACLIIGMIRQGVCRREKVKYGCTVFFHIVSLAAVFYWQLYQFWAI